jgi:hypothetical protein
VTVRTVRPEAGLPVFAHGLDADDYHVTAPLGPAAGWFAVVDRVDPETAP